ncbi:MAG: GNAT family N-acetyltransferase [Proteobacteria bacterium]|nr:GNAT family N-acetyltransferase [Pseudomonadota bacterium]
MATQKKKEIHWPARIPTLETARLRLRPISRRDTDEYFAINSNKMAMEMYGVLQHRRRAESEQLIGLLQRQFKKKLFLRWGITEKGNGRLIGDIGFWRFVDVRARAEIGAKLLPDFWNNGYMTEAMTAVLDYGFGPLNLQSIEGNADIANRGSIRMLQKLKFSEIGIIPRHTYSDIQKRYVDTALYNCPCEQWKEARRNVAGKRRS